jgi:hypothetical protein
LLLTDFDQPASLRPLVPSAVPLLGRHINAQSTASTSQKLMSRYISRNCDRLKMGRILYFRGYGVH